MHRKYKSLKKVKHNKTIPAMIVVCLLFGTISGTVRGISSDQIESVTEYLRENGFIFAAKKDVFRESLIKHAKIAVIIWFMAFVPAGWIVAAGLVFVRSYAYGFTAALLIRESLYAVLPYTPQMLILLPTYLYMTCRCKSYVTANTDNTDNSLINYFLPLLLGCVCSVIAAFVDAYLIPVIFILL